MKEREAGGKALLMLLDPTARLPPSFTHRIAMAWPLSPRVASLGGMHCPGNKTLSCTVIMHLAISCCQISPTPAVTTDKKVGIGFYSKQFQAFTPIGFAPSNHGDCGAQVKQVTAESQCSAPALLVCRGEYVSRSNFDLNNSVCQAYDIGHLLLVLTGNSSCDCWYCQKM